MFSDMHTTIKGILLTTAISMTGSTVVGYWAMSTTVLRQGMVVEQLQEKVETNTDTMKSLDKTLRSLEVAIAGINAILKTEFERRRYDYRYQETKRD